MPKLLTSDNLSTWLSTRCYANRNKNRTPTSDGDQNDNYKTRQARKSLAWERGVNSREDVNKNEDYLLAWLSPKRAKMMNGSNDAPSKLLISMETDEEGI